MRRSCEAPLYGKINYEGLGSLGKGHRGKARLGVFGQAGENHRNVKARVLAAGAGNNHAVAVNSPVVTGRLQSQSHFRPGRKRSSAAKFYAVLMKDDGIR